MIVPLDEFDNINQYDLYYETPHKKLTKMKLYKTLAYYELPLKVKFYYYYFILFIFK